MRIKNGSVKKINVIKTLVIAQNFIVYSTQQCGVNVKFNTILCRYMLKIFCVCEYAPYKNNFDYHLITQHRGGVVKHISIE
jgi:hypothetical protein